jgi:hypothetical protein
MEAGTTIKLQGKGEMFDPTFYETMATHYLGPIKDTIPFAEGGRVGMVAGGDAFKKFIEMLFIQASNHIRRGQGLFKGLNTEQKAAQHDNLTKHIDKFMKTGKLDKDINEFWGFDAELAFLDAQGRAVEKRPLAKGAPWFIKSINKNLEDMAANHPRYKNIPNEEKDLLAQQMQTLIHSLKAGDEVPKEALEAIYNNPQYYKTPRVQRGGDPEMVEVEELIQEKLLPDVSDELVNFETIGRKPNALGGGVGSMFRRV